jgi:hypothetical protein
MLLAIMSILKTLHCMKERGPGIPMEIRTVAGLTY